jgi:hypothetical protein
MGWDPYNDSIIVSLYSIINYHLCWTGIPCYQRVAPFKEKFMLYECMTDHKSMPKSHKNAKFFLCEVPSFIIIWNILCECLPTPVVNQTQFTAGNDSFIVG